MLESAPIEPVEWEGAESSSASLHSARTKKTDSPCFPGGLAKTTRRTGESTLVSSIEEATITVAQAQRKRRRRKFQHGSVQKRKSGRNWVWIGFWWDEENVRRAKTLGSCRELTRGEAGTKLANLIQPVN